MTRQTKTAIWAVGILGATALALRFKQKTQEELVAEILAQAKKDLEPLNTPVIKA